MSPNYFRWLPGLAIAAACMFAGCQPAARPVPVGAKAPPAPPSPPGSPTVPTSPPPIAGVQSAPAPGPTSGAKIASGLPADLVAKIDMLIQGHQDYIAAAEKVQDPQAAKDQVQEFRQRTERSSAIFEDILIASGKLPKDQQAKFEAYMNAHVTQVATQSGQHMRRLDALLQQSQ